MSVVTWRQIIQLFLKAPHQPVYRALSQMPDQPRDLFLDIGANHGQAITSIRLFKRYTRLVAFEPNPLLYQELVSHYADDEHLILRPYGLDATAGERILYVPMLDDSRASVEPHLALAGRPAKQVRLQEVACRFETLDAQMLSPTFIKINVPGQALEILLGGMTTLQRCQPVILIPELAHQPEALDLLKGIGYDAITMGENQALLMTPERYDESFCSKPAKLYSFSSRMPKTQPVGLTRFRAASSV